MKIVSGIPRPTVPAETDELGWSELTIAPPVSFAPPLRRNAPRSDVFFPQELATLAKRSRAAQLLREQRSQEQEEEGEAAVKTPGLHDPRVTASGRDDQGHGQHDGRGGNSARQANAARARRAADASDFLAAANIPSVEEIPVPAALRLAVGQLRQLYGSRMRSAPGSGQSIAVPVEILDQTLVRTLQGVLADLVGAACASRNPEPTSLPGIRRTMDQLAEAFMPLYLGAERARPGTFDERKALLEQVSTAIPKATGGAEETLSGLFASLPVWMLHVRDAKALHSWQVTA